MRNHFGERFKFPIPNKELERRWSSIRNSMMEQNIDALVIQNHNQFLGGYIRYFLDIPAPTYGTTILFHAKEEMSVISHGAIDGPSVPPEWAARGIGTCKTYPIIQTLKYTLDDASEAIVDIIKDLKYKKIGFVGLGLISAALYQYVTDNLCQVEIVDATDLVDEIKAIKSKEEIEYIRKAVELHDHLAAAVPTLFRVGRKESEIRSELKRLAADMGSEEQNIILGSAPNDKAFIVDPFFDNRTIQHGDRMVILLEVNGPGGFYGEIARTWCLGEPSKEILQAYDVATKSQKLIANMLKPGTSPAELFKANNDFLESHGYATEGRCFAHGQGYDMVERPAFVLRETMLLNEGMFLAIHPIAANDQALAFSCDNYLITAEGAELLTKTPQMVFSV